jgi:NitT/TauT family transport system ATP-binding protein
LNLNGNGIGGSLDLAARIRAAGHGFDFADAYAAGRALLAATRTLRIGEPFAFSMHRELLQYWLGPWARRRLRWISAPCRRP